MLPQPMPLIALMNRIKTNKIVNWPFIPDTRKKKENIGLLVLDMQTSTKQPVCTSAFVTLQQATSSLCTAVQNWATDQQLPRNTATYRPQCHALKIPLQQWVISVLRYERVFKPTGLFWNFYTTCFILGTLEMLCKLCCGCGTIIRQCYGSLDS